MIFYKKLTPFQFTFRLNYFTYIPTFNEPKKQGKSKRPLQSHFVKQGKGNLSLGKTQTSAFGKIQ